MLCVGVYFETQLVKLQIQFFKSYSSNLTFNDYALL